MAAYLLTWNPTLSRWNWLEAIDQTWSGKLYQMNWSTGGTRNIHRGDRLFLLKQRKEPRGIVASGVATSEVEEGEHWDAEGGTTTYVNADFETVLDPQSPLPRTVLDEWPLSTVYWDTPKSGIEIKPRRGTDIPVDIVAVLEERWAEHLSRVGFQGTESWDQITPLGREGRLKWRVHFYKERDRALVKAKKEETMRVHGALRCEICAFDFTRRYGRLGEGYIECHHTTPLSRLEEDHQTKPRELALVCANCHRMLHTGSEWVSVDELRKIVGQERAK